MLRMFNLMRFVPAQVRGKMLEKFMRLYHATICLIEKTNIRAVRCTYGSNVRAQCIYAPKMCERMCTLTSHSELSWLVAYHMCVSFDCWQPTATSLFSFPMFSWLIFCCSRLPNCCYCSILFRSFFPLFILITITKRLTRLNICAWEMNQTLSVFFLFMLHVFRFLPFERFFNTRYKVCSSCRRCFNLVGNSTLFTHKVRFGILKEKLVRVNFTCGRPLTVYLPFSLDANCFVFQLCISSSLSRCTDYERNGLLEIPKTTASSHKMCLPQW